MVNGTRLSAVDLGAGGAAERLHALDAVRGFALLLGIVLHATVSFVPTPTRIWFIQDTHQSMALGLLFYAIHVFRMTTFRSRPERSGRSPPCCMRWRYGHPPSR